jgi:dolichol-phosphate mannosyltransferase
VKNQLHSRILIFTATYNEQGNIQIWYEQVRLRFPEATLLIVDDNSTDGTNEYLRSMAIIDHKLYLHTRSSKLGLGSAHLYSYQFALKNEFQRLITLDADLSHKPSQLNRFLDSPNQGDFIIGTRWGAGSCNYRGVRKLLSFSANRIARTLLKTGLTEYTSSFRSFSPRALEVIVANQPKNDNYGFFLESIELLYQHDLSLSEVPIDFDDRILGKSKIPKNQIFVSAWLLTNLAFKRLFIKLQKWLNTTYSGTEL